MKISEEKNMNNKQTGKNKKTVITERKCKDCGEVKKITEMYNRTICLACLG
jgi:ribosomal protein S14